MKHLVLPSMMLRAALAGILALCASPALAQVTWQTTKTTNATKDVGNASLLNGTLRVKAFPGYLDVEEDVDISVSGTVRAQNDPATIEILGTFTLPAGAVITGALLWDGNRILQAKLLDRYKADSTYEDLVDRDSVPPPRPIDPLILERTGTNTYRVRVYPVALNQSRHFRLRYQLPPKIGTDGFEMRLQAALIPLFTSVTTVTTTIEPGGGVSTVGFVENGLKREMTLPRTLFLARSSLTAATAAGASALRILPVNPLRQVQVKTSFPTGSFAGNYLNFYGAVDDSLLRDFGLRIEVVFYWKWHNPGEWKFNSSYVSEAQSQASSLLTLYGLLGLPGNRVGLLHDDSRNSLRSFSVGAQSETSYKLALDYLKSVQGSYVQDFVNNIQFSGGGGVANTTASKNKFLANMQVVKTLYSPDQGVVRHLVLVSAGPDYVNSDASLNAAFDEAFLDKPVSISTLKNRNFTQVGFDMFAARQGHPVLGTVTSTSHADLPGFPSLSVLATVRNSQKAYDLSVACTGGLSITCGSLEFHGKSANPWRDTVEWAGYQGNGQLLGRVKRSSAVFTAAQDTGMALVWAGSTAPFSEVKEYYLGPHYGFVDANASLLALERDSIKGAYADTGVPYAGSIPDYLGPSSPPSTGNPNSILGGARNAASWRIERAADGMLRLRVPGLAAGERVELSLVDLKGKRVGSWMLTAEAGLLRWNAGALRAGTYLLRLKGKRVEGEKLITLP
ncbi:MAG: Vault protein inter-alpha-trypsin domain [Fibrobacteria bacterium]|jgi:hypothetical protein|nr:Vault protein inter-alpha-trypsin domain [Fibrobacteria bacterium]